MERLIVLKISTQSEELQTVTIKLEGEILEPFVETVRDACKKWQSRAKCVRLDLAGVSYVDAAGARLLSDLMRAGVQVAACSNFISELLRHERV